MSETDDAVEPLAEFVDVADIFGNSGALADAIDGFLPRQQQQQLAEAVEHTLENKKVLIAEAGTGTGKTFAYLVPALQLGKRVIVSTGTKNLQDQLFKKDLPIIRDALKKSLKLALLKGRSNYLCRERLGHALLDADYSTTQRRTLQQVERWMQKTRSGDLAECSALPEDSMLRPAITSTADNCLGQECPEYDNCHVLKARRNAQAADLVVINHHLLFADMALKEEGFGELLPGASAVIVDEAHQLPETAGQFFGESVSSRQLRDICRELRVVQQQDAADAGELSEQAGLLDKAILDARLVLGDRQQRVLFDSLLSDRRVAGGFDEVLEQLETLYNALKPHQDRSIALDALASRCLVQLTRLKRLLGRDEAEQNSVRWLETYARSFLLHATPLDVAPMVGRYFADEDVAWVFTSATLAVNGQFDHFAGRLGIEDAVTLQVGSPFDYGNNSLLYVPKDLPEPNHPDYTSDVVKAVLPILEDCTGGAFLLFTSHRALQEAAEILKRKCDRMVLVQGEAPKGELIERFRNDGEAVLLGAASFWEGVDVQGAALQLVMIDKLPFASPGEPVLQARLDAMRKDGGNPFNDFQLPQAVITLKQGAGRLIRGVHDQGVLMICDPRLFGKSYGRQFRGSLPPMPVTRDPADVTRFFQQVSQS